MKFRRSNKNTSKSSYRFLLESPKLLPKQKNLFYLQISQRTVKVFCKIAKGVCNILHCIISHKFHWSKMCFQLSKNCQEMFFIIKCQYAASVWNLSGSFFVNILRVLVFIRLPGRLSFCGDWLISFYEKHTGNSESCKCFAQCGFMRNYDFEKYCKHPLLPVYPNHLEISIIKFWSRQIIVSE